MENNAKFVFPKQLLNQLAECSNGFFLVAVNQDNQFEIYQNLNSPILHMGMMNFLDVFSDSMQEQLRSKPLGGMPGGENQAQSTEE